MVSSITLTFAWAHLFHPAWVHFFDRPITFWSDGPGFTRYIANDNEWTLRFPSSWHAVHIADRGPRLGRGYPATYGVFISNMNVDDRDLWRDGMPAGVVAVRVVADYPGGILIDQFLRP